MQQTTVFLYTTLGCHLCEEAKRVLWELADEHSFQLQEVEISESDGLVERYGVRIPVIAVAGVANDLGWPFSLEEARELLLSAQ